MRSSRRHLLRSVFRLGSGEALGRLSSIGIVVLLGHQYGVVILGVYALAQSITQYLQPLIDFGLRHVGARLLALYPQAAGDIVNRVQRRRLLMGALVLPGILIYAISVNLPTSLKVFLFVFSSVGVLYAVSLDWVAWGKEQLFLVGLARTVVPLSILAFLAMARGNKEHVLWWAAAGNTFGYVLQAAGFWAWWKTKEEGHHASEVVRASISDSLAWPRTSIMGLASLCNLAFNTIDMLMLGLMSNPQQVGLYSAAYRVVNYVLFFYYLLTQTLYPQFARHRAEDRARMLRAPILMALFGAGIAIAAVVIASRSIVLGVVFGHRFLEAAPLLLLLACCIPLDFLTSYLSNAYIAWGMQTKTLLCTLVAAGSNVLLNLIWIPKYGATAAAVNTLVSYVIFLAGLALAGRTEEGIARGTQPQTELTA